VGVALIDVPNSDANPECDCSYSYEEFALWELEPPVPSIQSDNWFGGMIVAMRHFAPLTSLWNVLSVLSLLASATHGGQPGRAKSKTKYGVVNIVGKLVGPDLLVIDTFNLAGNLVSCGGCG
jgi:hypothetical protein